MTDTHKIKTTLEDGREIVTVFDGDEKDAARVHRAEIMLAREVANVEGITDRQSFTMAELCSALDRLDGACAGLAEVVGDGVEALGCIDPARLPRVGPQPEVSTDVPPVAWTETEAIVRERTDKGGVRWSVRTWRQS